jgi:hypothetical protein
MPVIPALEKLRQEDHEFKASLGYTAYFTKTKNRRERERERMMVRLLEACPHLIL